MFNSDIINIWGKTLSYAKNIPLMYAGVIKMKKYRLKIK